jgi:polysaccharide export outer membrane protein
MEKLMTRRFQNKYLNRALLLGASTLLYASSTVWAQTNRPNAARVSAAKVSAKKTLPRVSSSYQLGPGDSISVNVEGHPQFSDNGVIIPPDGRIYLPVAGTLRVTGKTVAQVTSEVRSRLSSRLREPRVTVNIRDLRPRVIEYINLVGDAIRPGVIELRPGWRLTEALAAVGGAVVPLEDTAAALSRAGSKQIKINLYAAVSRPSSAANIRLRSNDTLSITKVVPAHFAIVGDVTKPGTYVLRESPRLRDCHCRSRRLESSTRRDARVHSTWQPQNRS